MLRSPNPNRRVVGRLMVVSAIAVALPLTAGRAVEYLDVAVLSPAPGPVSVVAAPVVTAVAAAAAVQPVAPARPVTSTSGPVLNSGDLTIDEDRVIIDGQTKRWEELTPQERTRVRAAVASARTALANTHINEAQIREALRNVPDRKRMEDIRREVEQAQANAAEAANNISVNSEELRRWGVNPEQMAANIRAALQSVQGLDLSGLAAIDRDKISADVAGAQQSVEKAKAQLERIQARMDAEDRR